MAQYYKVDEESLGKRLDVFLTEMLTDIPSRSLIQKLIDNGHVKVNERIVKVGYKLRIGDDVNVEIPEDFFSSRYAAPENIPLNIFYDDESFLIINKESGMTVHPGANCIEGTVVNALLYKEIELSKIEDEMRPGIVHRLDKDTSGLLLIAKDNIAHAKLAKQFERHSIRKTYIALVEGEVAFDEGKIDEPLGPHPRDHEKRAIRRDDRGKESLTYYKVLKRSKGVSLVALFPHTGRTHQLRVHMAYLKHPILGDEKYGHKNTFPRLALHAQAIGFQHPRTGRQVEFSSVPPKEFLECVANK
ncbi:MAG: RluA family pseudouridine synthase [Candidatus Omnitrophica bacterium]|nr:RluA family pseudouridine synthase [Candidatus Omnitrophota bacterium]